MQGALTLVLIMMVPVIMIFFYPGLATALLHNLLFAAINGGASGLVGWYLAGKIVHE